MRVELAIFDGSPLEWFSLIGILKTLFHNARRSPDGKLAIVRCHLKGKCRDVYANASSTRPIAPISRSPPAASRYLRAMDRAADRSPEDAGPTGSRKRRPNGTGEVCREGPKLSLRVESNRRSL